MDRNIIELYAQGAELVTRAIAGLTPADFVAFPVPNTWSIQQIVIHLQDSDLIAADRMKRIAAEDCPLIVNYDETRFAERLQYHKADPMLAGQLFSLNRKVTAAMLRTLPDETFDRVGVHTQKGKLTLGDVVQMYYDHLHHHLKFLYHKRHLLGKPLAM
ncbi:MAG: DinB family protein [Pyrinomonadaceae bacterium]|nr:DinB family protein [Phycisphaerales bacterium]